MPPPSLNNLFAPQQTVSRHSKAPIRSGLWSLIPTKRLGTRERSVGHDPNRDSVLVRQRG